MLGSPTATDTASGETWSLANRWIDRGTKELTRCKRLPTDFKWYPTYLLDIEILQAATDVIRLIVTAYEAIDGPYVTLSHC
jgi:hypothetical protein